MILLSIELEYPFSHVYLCTQRMNTIHTIGLAIGIVIIISGLVACE